jgi:hypothetical protein
MRNLIKSSSPVLTILRNTHQQSFRQLSRIGDKTKHQFIEFVEGGNLDPYQSYHETSQLCGKFLEDILPPETTQQLKDLGRKGRSVLLLENCPIVGKKDLPPTPIISQRSPEKDLVSESWMLGVGALLGATPYIVEGVRDETVINQVIPTDPTSKGGSGSLEPFELHTETVHKKNPPDFFLLLGLRGHPLAKTNYCSLEDILQFLPPEIMTELEKPNFIMKSGDPKTMKTEEFRCPILTKDQSGQYKLRLNTAESRCVGATDEAKFALTYITDCIRNKVDVHHVVLDAGKLLVINNNTAMHGRTRFDADVVNGQTIDPGQRRWAQRLMLIGNDNNQNQK